MAIVRVAEKCERLSLTSFGFGLEKISRWNRECRAYETTARSGSTYGSSEVAVSRNRGRAGLQVRVSMQ
jgi:hypothetical protein